MLENHPLADLFPMMLDDELAGLKASIDEVGQEEPIVLFDGKILDGRNRYKVCIELGLEPETVDFWGDDPVDFIIRKNLHRRHLSTNQRAVLGAKLATMKQGRPADNPAKLPVLTQPQAATVANISERSIRQAVVVLEKGIPELQKAVQEDRIAISVAAEVALLDQASQEAMLDTQKDDISSHAKTLIKQRNRDKKERDLAVSQRSTGQQSLKETSITSFPDFNPTAPQAIDALSIGKAGEHLVCADLLKRGYKAFLSDQGLPFDVVVEFGGALLKIQVKTTMVPRNVNAEGRNPRMAYSFSVARRGKEGKERLSHFDTDLVAMVCLDRGFVAYMPMDDCGQTVQLLEPGQIFDKGYARKHETIFDYPIEKALIGLANTNRITQLKNILPPFPSGNFGVLYADPCWSFDTWSQGGKDRAADNHYPTLNAELLYAMGRHVPSANDCVLFLWSTVPHFKIALKLIDRWGFSYKSHTIWLKDKAGTGYWTRNKHEILCVATKGNIPAPAPGTQWLSVIEAPVGEHSEKPDVFYDLIESYFPNLPKLELFARRPRTGWISWGNEMPFAQQVMRFETTAGAGVPPGDLGRPTEEETVDAAAPAAPQGDERISVKSTGSQDNDNGMEIPPCLKRG